MPLVVTQVPSETVAACNSGGHATLSEAQAVAVACGCDPILAHFMGGSYMVMGCTPTLTRELPPEGMTAAACNSGGHATLSEAQAVAVACGCDPKLAHFMGGSYMVMGCTPTPTAVQGSQKGGGPVAKRG
jgi:hypothetical protein